LDLKALTNNGMYPRFILSEKLDLDL